MARYRAFACEECTEEFVVAGSLYASPDWILCCPCCGSTGVRPIADQELGVVEGEAA